MPLTFLNVRIHILTLPLKSQNMHHVELIEQDPLEVKQGGRGMGGTKEPEEMVGKRCMSEGNGAWF